jgi:hypothetical protein
MKKYGDYRKKIHALLTTTCPLDGSGLSFTPQEIPPGTYFIPCDTFGSKMSRTDMLVQMDNLGLYYVILVLNSVAR